MVDLKDKPFDLDDAGEAWVRKTLSAMGEDEKIGQLFCLIAYASDEEGLRELVRESRPGGVMCRPMPSAEVVKAVRAMQDESALPLLIAANLEKGGNGLATDGTMIGSPLAVAATSDEGMAAKLGEICGSEGAAVGCNWAFAPIIDIDYNFRNPITNIRTFGSDPDRVRRMGVEYVKAVQKRGLAASIKHFPGDGMDERDQHLVTSINSLSCEEWDRTYGAAYKACIEAGAKTVMVGHIMQPAYSKRLDPGLADEDILPASLSKELLQGLLRGMLGFKGLVVTDASTMAGMCIPMPRSKVVPLAIAAGCDMFLFTRNLQEDLEYMKAGIREGVISRERLDEAVTRVLGLKASLGLPAKKAAGTLVPATPGDAVGSAEHKAWAKECADKSVTLVKEEKGVLPLSAAKSPRVLFYPIESEQGYAYSVRGGVAESFRKSLESEGFQITQFVPAKGNEGMMTAESDFLGKYDLIIYLANMGTKSNQTTVRIEWAQPMGANVPIRMSSIPTIFVSVENPYHLLDLPRVRTFINAYCSTDEALTAVVDKLMGRSKFKGTSPIDPFCGKWDTHLS
jgi:Beta-glucosidase-related glycosidases